MYLGIWILLCFTNLKTSFWPEDKLTEELKKTIGFLYFEQFPRRGVVLPPIYGPCSIYTLSFVLHWLFCRWKVSGSKKNVTGGGQTTVELEVVTIENMDYVGVKRKRIQGDAFTYKNICEEVNILQFYLK